MNKILATKNVAAVLLGVALVVTFAFAFFINNTPKEASAQPSTFCYDQSSGSTSTLSYMSAGNATTTLTASNCVDGSTALDNAVVNIEWTASSSVSSVLGFRVEQSYDNKDWFPVNCAVGTNATTTTWLAQNFCDFRLSGGATTTDTGGSGTTARLHTSIPISFIHGPYLRTKFYIPVGSQNGAIWAQIVGLRQMR